MKIIVMHRLLACLILMVVVSSTPVASAPLYHPPKIAPAPAKPVPANFFDIDYCHDNWHPFNCRLQET